MHAIWTWKGVVCGLLKSTSGCLTWNVKLLYFVSCLTSSAAKLGRERIEKLRDKKRKARRRHGKCERRHCVHHAHFGLCPFLVEQFASLPVQIRQRSIVRTINQQFINLYDAADHSDYFCASSVARFAPEVKQTYCTMG